jgi:hypothetical protein
VCRVAWVVVAVGAGALAGCGAGPDAAGTKPKAPPQVLTVDEFFADPNPADRDLRLVGQLKAWKGNPGAAFGSTDAQVTIAGEQGKTCVVFVPTDPKGPQPGGDAPKVGKWVAVDVTGSNKPHSRTNGEFTRGRVAHAGSESLAEALKLAGR